MAERRQRSQVADARGGLQAVRMAKRLLHVGRGARLARALRGGQHLADAVEVFAVLFAECRQQLLAQVVAHILYLPVAFCSC